MVGTSLGTTTGGAAAGYLTSISLVFTAGEHAGSSLSVEGPLVGFKGGAAVERAVVGGTGRFRLARGYSLTTILGNPTYAGDGAPRGRPVRDVLVQRSYYSNIICNLLDLQTFTPNIYNFVYHTFWCEYVQVHQVDWHIYLYPK
jgi:hypothetical protein